MKRFDARWIAVVGVVIGAAFAWLWAGGAAMLAGRSAPEPQTVTLHSLSRQRLGPQPPEPQPTESKSRRSGGPSENSSGRTPSVVAAVPRPEATSPQATTPKTAIPEAPNDATYSRVLALAAARPDAAQVTRRIVDTHERFLLTPDDPGWARPTEQALRDFFRSRSANASNGIDITSVACRSAGCEVQAVVRMTFEPGGSEIPDQESGRKDPREVLREIWPVGPSLKQQTYIGSDLLESQGAADIGFLVWYRRIEPGQGAPSPNSPDSPAPPVSPQ